MQSKWCSVLKKKKIFFQNKGNQSSQNNKIYSFIGIFPCIQKRAIHKPSHSKI